VAEDSTPVWRSTLKRRLLVAAALLVVWSAAIQARLVYWQIVRHDAIIAKANRQQLGTVTVPGRRGELRDRNGRPLAMTGDALSIKAVPGQVDDAAATVRAVCGVFGNCDAEERAKLVARLTSRKKFVYIRQFVEADVAARVEQLDLAGVGIITESRRLYPNNDFASHLLGYVNMEDRGVSGLENAYNSLSQGREGSALINKDVNNVAVRKRLEVPPTTGATLELTIDSYIQWVLERELEAGVLENHATSGTAIVLDPWSGEVLGMASYPSFNPNEPLPSNAVLHNPAVEDVYEPGSTFKIVTASAALEQHVIRAEDVIDVSGGRIQFGSDVIHDTHVNQSLTFTDVIVKSSNVGAIKVGLMLGRTRLADYVRRFGFGRHTSRRDFPAESPGIVWDAAKLTDSALARVSMGYQVGVTPLQMAAAVSSIANGGELVLPRAVRAVIKDGQRRPVPRVVLNRTVAPEIATPLTGIMEGVVERGTGTDAQIPGYTVAGKTGTAAKLVNGRYSKTDYNASFVGFVPSRKPVYTIIVVTDSPHGPHGYYGGPVSAPVFKRIAEQLLRKNGVPRTINPPAPLLVQRTPDGGREIPASGPATVPVVAPPVAHGNVFPDVTGLSARDALRLVGRLATATKIHGDGLVVDQRPAAGAPLAANTTVTLWLTRDSSAVRTPNAATQ
jgi:cell division protein FtsI/penicillin-binding protein 2